MQCSFSFKIRGPHMYMVDINSLDWGVLPVALLADNIEGRKLALNLQPIM